MERLVGKVAVVTGGASGFGAAILERFLAEGAQVVIADLEAERGCALAAAAPETTAFIRTDVTSAGDIRGMIDFAVERFGGLDILVNNAGVGQRPQPLTEVTEADFQRILDANLRSVFLGCQAVLPVFRRQGRGTIINTASGIALTPRPQLLLYAASKGAVVAFSKGLAMELAPEGFRVNALCPAIADTPMLTEFMGGVASEEVRDAFAAGIPLGRLVAPEDVAAAAAYLASDDAAMITGTCLAVDGGRCI